MGRHGCAATEDTIGPIRLLMEAIEAELILHEEHHEGTGGDPNRQADEVDGGVDLLPEKVPDGDGEIVAEHSGEPRGVRCQITGPALGFRLTEGSEQRVCQGRVGRVLWAFVWHGRHRALSQVSGCGTGVFASGQAGIHLRANELPEPRSWTRLDDVERKKGKVREACPR